MSSLNVSLVIVYISFSLFCKRSAAEITIAFDSLPRRHIHLCGKGLELYLASSYFTVSITRLVIEPSCVKAKIIVLMPNWN